jgi:7-cyano-7-deazaguanine synthase in queuosine biosynthesis
MIIGGYTLHLYCDDVDCMTSTIAVGDANEFAGRNQKLAMEAALANGWQFYTTDSGLACARCPACTRKQLTVAKPIEAKGTARRTPKRGAK